MKVHEVVAARVRAHVPCVFGVMGDANFPVVVDLASDADTTYVAASHEAGAVLMAEGYARARGGVGVALLTHGPGLTNGLTAIAEAARNGTPLVVLTGRTPERIRHFQELDLRAAAALAGAAFEVVRAAGTTAGDLDRAFRLARTRATPVVVDVPFASLFDEVSDDGDGRLGALLGPKVGLWLAEEGGWDGPLARTSPPAEALEEAAALLSAARRPLVVGGWGAVLSGAGDALVALARTTGARLATTLRARGLFDGDPADLGVIGSVATPEASALIADADVVVAFGAALNPYTTYGGAFLEGRRVVVCELDPSAVGQYARPDVALVGDARTTAERLADLVGELRDDAAAAPRWGVVAPAPAADSTGVLDVAGVLGLVDDLVAPDRILVTDLGRAAVRAWDAVRVRGGRSFLPTVGFGSIGLGLGTAIGAAFAHPTRPTVLVTGDGGWAMSLQELAVATRHGLDLLVVVFEDGGYGVEWNKLGSSGLDPEHARVAWPAAAPVAAAMGAQARTVATYDDLAQVSADWIRGSGPKVLGVRLTLDWPARHHPG